MSTPPEPRPLAAWLRALDEIEATLARWLPPAAELAPAAPAAAGDLPAAQMPLALLDERLAGGFQNCLDRAERNAAEADTLLTGEVQALEGWLAALAAARQTLAGTAAPES
jgi:hypothetical protein